MADTIFDKIINGEIESRVVWEDENHIAFLTPFPNTPGLTVVIPKKNIGDNVFSLSEKEYTDLLFATKKVANILEKALGVDRVALVFEGTGVAYVHAKLYPHMAPSPAKPTCGQTQLSLLKNTEAGLRHLKVQR